MTSKLGKEIRWTFWSKTEKTVSTNKNSQINLRQILPQRRNSQAEKLKERRSHLEKKRGFKRKKVAEA